MDQLLACAIDMKPLNRLIIRQVGCFKGDGILPRLQRHYNFLHHFYPAIRKRNNSLILIHDQGIVLVQPQFQGVVS